jgi:hypothetical protein
MSIPHQAGMVDGARQKRLLDKPLAVGLLDIGHRGKANHGPSGAAGKWYLVALVMGMEQ